MIKPCSKPFEQLWKIEQVTEVEPIPPGRSSVQAVETLKSSDPDRDQRRFEQVIGKSSALEAVFEQVEYVEPPDSTALMQGEAGSGQDLLTHTSHNVSTVWARVLVSV